MIAAISEWEGGRSNIRQTPRVFPSLLHMSRTLHSARYFVPCRNSPATTKSSKTHLDANIQASNSSVTKDFSLGNLSALTVERCGAERKPIRSGSA